MVDPSRTARDACNRLDPFIRSRIEAARTLSAADYMAMLRDRTVLVRAMDARLSDLDALALPTTPIVAPTITEVSSSEGFTARSALVLRNPAIANFFDLCAISFRCRARAGCRLD